MPDRDRPGPAGVDDGPAETPVLGLLTALIAARRTIIAVTLFAIAVAALMALVRPRRWLVEVSFVPEGQALPSGLSGLAEQFGVNLPRGDPSSSPGFYQEVLRSRELLRAVAVAPLPAEWGCDSTIQVVESLRSPGSTPEERVARAVVDLRRLIAVSAEPRSGLVKARVKTTDVCRSSAIARALLAELHRFNTDRRQTRAGAERRFAEARLVDARQALRGAEESLEQFMSRNRVVAGDPRLTFQQTRLTREVSLHQSVVMALTQAYEQARLEEVRDTPKLTVLQPPYRPERPERRGLLLAIMLGAAAGVAFAVLFVLVRFAWSGVRITAPESAGALESEVRRSLAGIPRPFRRRSG
jgi:uncharacterized protein involved in exopolysaccharide biosynthesis